jgi:hypothetical protein
MNIDHFYSKSMIYDNYKEENLEFTVFFRYFYDCKCVYVLNLFSVKYYFLGAFATAIAFKTTGQTVSSNATLTIIGDPIPEAPAKSTTPPDKGQQLAAPQNIEPTFDNGFHIRYEINTPQKIEERPTNTGYAYASISGGTSSGEKIKKKHVTTIAERSFNFKKRFKSWVPKRKKKYRPHICGRFK